MLGLRQLFRLVDCTEPFLLYLLIAHDPRRFPLQTHQYQVAHEVWCYLFDTRSVNALRLTAFEKTSRAYRPMTPVCLPYPSRCGSRNTAAACFEAPLSRIIVLMLQEQCNSFAGSLVLMPH